jgi:hypothetical protein
LLPCTARDDPRCDADLDGVINADDPALDDPCLPTLDVVACAVGDADEDGAINGVDPDDADACVPSIDAPRCPDGDEVPELVASSVHRSLHRRMRVAAPAVQPRATSRRVNRLCWSQNSGSPVLTWPM